VSDEAAVTNAGDRPQRRSLEPVGADIITALIIAAASAHTARCRLGSRGECIDFLVDTPTQEDLQIGFGVRASLAAVAA
jgi:hypothetical protein